METVYALTHAWKVGFWRL